MSPGNAVRTVLGKYATFSGRARRSEYWWWSLAQGLAVLVPYVLAMLTLAVASQDGPIQDPPVLMLVLLGLMVLLSLGLFLPSLAVLVRRLHDTGRSGWWYFISLVPFGGLVLFVFTLMDSSPGTNQHGPNPKGVQSPYAYGAPQGYAATGQAPQAYDRS